MSPQSSRELPQRGTKNSGVKTDPRCAYRRTVTLIEEIGLFSCRSVLGLPQVTRISNPLCHVIRDKADWYYFQDRQRSFVEGIPDSRKPTAGSPGLPDFRPSDCPTEAALPPLWALLASRAPPSECWPLASGFWPLASLDAAPPRYAFSWPFNCISHDDR
jgi:hypothetical protein